jgi:transposase
MHTAQRALLMTQVWQLEHVLRDQVLATPAAQHRVWVPGIGKMVACTLLLEIDDIRRFPTVRHFHSYCRLVPGSANSGGKIHLKRSRDGSRYVKIAFHHAAIRAIRHFADVKREFQRLQRRKGRPSPARSSPKNSRRSCTRCSARRKPSMDDSVDRS